MVLKKIQKKFYKGIQSNNILFALKGYKVRIKNDSTEYADRNMRTKLMLIYKSRVLKTNLILGTNKTHP